MIPHNIEAEKALLGAVIQNPQSILKVVTHLKPSDFFTDENQMVYEAMVRLQSRHATIDLITLEAELSNQERLDKIGGREYIEELHANGSNIESYADVIREASRKRKLSECAAEIMGLAHDTTVDADTAVSKSRESLLKVGLSDTSNSESVMEIGERELPRIQRKFEHPNETWALATGIKALDNALGGLEKRDNIVIAGRPGSGKSALADTIAINVANRGKHVVLFTMEMSKAIRMERMVCIHGGFDFTEFKRGKKHMESGGLRDWTDDEQIDYYHKYFEVERLPITINDTAAITTTQIESTLSEIAMTSPVDLVIGDYMGLMGDAPTAKRYEQVGTISRGIKRVAMNIDVPFLNLAQLNRQCEERADKKPELADLRDSGDIEQDADVVILIWRPAMYWRDSAAWHAAFPKDPYPGETVAELNIAKYRNGATGFVRIAFDAPRMRFMDLGVGYET